MAAYKTQNFTATFNNPGGGTSSIDVKNERSLYNFLGGVQIKDNASESRLRPFAHLLIGVGHNRNKITQQCSGDACPPILLSNRTFTDTGFAGAFGGGLDIRINNKIDFRAIQIDHDPISIPTAGLIIMFESELGSFSNNSQFLLILGSLLRTPLFFDFGTHY